MKTWTASLRKNLTRSLPVVLTTSGLFLMGANYAIKNDYIKLNLNKTANGIVEFVTLLGEPILIGGVFGSLLKTYQYLGIFKDAVKEVVFEKPSVDEETLKDLWRKISTAIYKGKFPELADFLQSTILEKYFPTQYEFYYSEFEVSCVFSWKDRSKRIIQRDETADLTIVPFDARKEISHIYFLKRPLQEGGKSFVDTIKKLTINDKVFIEEGEAKSGLVRISEAKEDGDEVIYKYEISLSGAKEYKVTRKSVTEFSLDFDPFIEYTSRNFIKSARINVQTREDDLRIDFVSLGTLEDFKPIGHFDEGSPATFSRVYRNLLFPNQGFILVFRMYRQES